MTTPSSAHGEMLAIDELLGEFVALSNSSTFAVRRFGVEYTAETRVRKRAKNYFRR